jgi:hypothetical protein
MARARNIKPSFFKSEQVADCNPYARLLFIGLWTLADRRGRLEDRPRTIKAECLPFDIEQDCHALLQELHNANLIIRYEVKGMGYIWIPNFEKHQNPHIKEGQSEIPEYKGEYSGTRLAPDLHHTSPAESLILNPESPILNPEGGASPPRGKYAFEGNVVKISYKDMEKFINQYPYINVLPTLKSLDETWTRRKEAGENVMGWFFGVTGALVNANLEQKAMRGEVKL